MNCPICSSSDRRRLYRLPMGAIGRCTQCQTVCRENLVAGQELLSLYDDSTYLDSVYFQRLKLGAPTDVEPHLIYADALDWLERKLPERGRLLDVGCSYGAFMDTAKQRGWDVCGVDVSTQAAAYARDIRGLTVTAGMVETVGFLDGSFDVVTLWDVIEHLDDPLKTMKDVHRVLRAGGIAVVFTINQRSLINKVGHLIWRLSLGKVISPLAALYDIHHNFFFDPETLSAVLGRAGLQVIDVDWREAMIERWHSRPLPKMMMIGCDILDRVSRFAGEKYRAITYASKSQEAPLRLQ
jgi:SAM-dependent methyltransferase